MVINIKSINSVNENQSAQHIENCVSAGAMPCPNPQCRGGYAPRLSAPFTLRVCPSCDGFGFLRSVPENRKRYYALRNVSSELELQSRLGRGLTPQSSRKRALDEPHGDIQGIAPGAPVNDIEHMIASKRATPSCERVS
jgi:hypothetical protein